jgi:hypothetical protein
MAALSTPDPTPQPQQTESGGAPVEPENPDAARPSFGEKNRHLPDALKDVLTAIVKEFANEELYDRRIEDLTDRALRFYDDGVQHFYPNYATGVYQIGEAGGSVNIGNGSQECSEYLGAYNIFRARRRTIDSVLTQNPPPVDFQPDRPRSEDIEASETAEGYWELFKQKNDMQDLQQAVTRYFELSGRVVSWTFQKTDRQKWGLVTNPDSPNFGKPCTMETAEIFGTLESTVPILCRRQEDAIYCYVYRDTHILKAKEENPWLKENGAWKISGGEGGPGESEWKRYARLGVRQARKGAAVLNTTIGHLITEQHCFLRPAAFMSDRCDAIYTGPSGWDEEAQQPIMEPALDDEGEPQTIRGFLQTLFPEGVHLKYLGKSLSEATPESMDDCVDITMSEKRDSLTGGALMEPMKILQDTFNDFKNAEREYYEKGWPMTHFKGDSTDYDTIVDQQSRPAQFNLIKSPVGPPDMPLENSFYREPDMNVPQSFQECIEETRGPLSQDITGASPALEGVAGPHDETASQRAMDKTQSIGILGPTWSATTRVFAGMAKKAALLAAKNPDHEKEIVVATGDKQTVTIRLEKLTRGSFHTSPDNDSTFPDSTGAQRANLDATMPVIAASPVGAEMFESPDNWEEYLRIKGMSNFTLIPALAYRKQTREIDLLLKEAPVDNSAAVNAYNVQHAQQTLQAMQAGQPPPPYQPPPPQMPSIMPDQHDYHAWEYKKCQQYLSTEDCYREIISGGSDGKGNEAGVQNVRLHADAHAMMGQAPQPFQTLPPDALPPAPPMPPQAQAPAAQPPGVAGIATI